MPVNSEAAPVDLSYLHDYTDGDKDAINELLEIFHETFSEELENLHIEIVEGDSQSWCEIAHKLKGAAGYIGAEELRALCSQAQNMKTCSKEERAEIYEKIEGKYRFVCDFLKAQN